MEASNKREQKHVLVGVEALDLDHQNLFDELEVLDKVAEKGGDRNKIIELMEDFVNHADQHFKREELFLVETQYPQAERHSAKHKRLKAELRMFVEQIYLDKELAIEAAILSFLKYWLLDHIQKEDLAYAKFLKSRGI